MAKIKRRKVRWSNNYYASDVVGYKLYWASSGSVDYNSDCVEVGNVNEVILPDDITSFPVVSGDIEIGVTAVNQTGNESDMTKLFTNLDFTAPDAPTDLVVEVA